MSAAHGVANLVVAVTGATGGIGMAIAKQLTGSGAAVALGCHPDELEAGKELADRLGPDVAEPFPLDVTKAQSCQEFSESATRRFTRIDGLVNNAGILEQLPFDEINEEAWERTLAVNTTGAYHCIKSFLPVLRDGPSGSIVNMSSQMAYVGGADAAAYCTSKAAILGLTRALAHEFAPRLRVNAVAPGPIHSPMTTPHMGAEWNDLKTRRLAMQRFGTTDEVAAAVVFLLGRESSYFTGQTLSPNGGGAMP